MIILLFVIFLVLTGLALAFGEDELATIPGIGAFICLIAAVVLGINISKGSVIQEKIDMYTEENQKIENDIAILVEKYMDYEGEIMEGVSNESAITLVNLYPDLKSSELVSGEIDVHMENNRKIKELKERQITLKVYKWWLYFGGRK